MLLVAASLTSCWTKQTVVTKQPQYLYNTYDQMKGYTKSQIYQAMGDVQDRSMPDGNGGEILVYENRKIVTNSSSTTTTTSNTNSAAVAGYDIYGNPAAVGASQTKTNTGYSSKTTTQEQKNYVNFFIGTNGKCYRVQSNVGNVYSPAEYGCVKQANKNLLWMLMPPITPIGIISSIWYGCNKDKTKPCNY